jgi:uncharacterized membrane protein
MKHMAQNGFKALTSACALSLLATVAWSQGPSIRWLGTHNGNRSIALGVSQDGSVVIGTISYSGYDRAFRWTAAGMEVLNVPGSDPLPLGISWDGSVIVGLSIHYIWYYRGFIWTADSGVRMVDCSGFDSTACYGISGNGLIVVGGSSSPSYGWSGPLGSPCNLIRCDRSSLNDASYDGSVAAGYCGHDGSRRAIIYRRATGTVQQLGLPPGYPEAFAWGISGDGSVVIGLTFSSPNWDSTGAFYWTESEGARVLSTLGGAESGVFKGISVDGSVIVGTSQNAAGEWRAVRWRRVQGQYRIEDLNQTYAALLANGSVLRSAYGMSPDGRYIVGWGRNAATGRDEAFLLDTNAPNGDLNGDGCVDDGDLLQVLFAFGQTDPGHIADVNFDGIVDDADLLIVLFNFGSGC